MKHSHDQLREEQAELGDVAPEIFRDQLHQLADWIGDYRENIGERRIAPNDPPGTILKQLDTAPPEAGSEG